eukprot:scaffold221_cov351-Pavlova_lutheri.AAC.33
MPNARPLLCAGSVGSDCSVPPVPCKDRKGGSPNKGRGPSPVQKVRVSTTSDAQHPQVMSSSPNLVGHRMLWRRRSCDRAHSMKQTNRIPSQ